MTLFYMHLRPQNTEISSMKVHSKFQIYLYATILSVCSIAHAAPKEIKFSDSAVTISSKSSPMIALMKSQFSLNDDGGVAYRYTIENDEKNDQDIVSIVLNEVSQIIGSRDDRDFKITYGMDSTWAASILKENSAALVSPPGWRGSITFGMYHKDNIRVGWNPLRDEGDRSLAGIKPGMHLANFGFDSSALPGIGSAQMEGESSTPIQIQYDYDSSISIIDQLMKIEEHAHALDNAAVPAILIQTPFDPSETLTQLQDHMRKWVTASFLDRSFHATLSRSIQKAIKAYRNKDTQVAKEHLEATRKLIREEQPNIKKGMSAIRYASRGLTIDILAARILDFNLKYVIYHTVGKD